MHPLNVSEHGRNAHKQKEMLQKKLVSFVHVLLLLGLIQSSNSEDINSTHISNNMIRKICKCAITALVGSANVRSLHLWDQQMSHSFAIHDDKCIAGNRANKKEGGQSSILCNPNRLTPFQMAGGDR